MPTTPATSSASAGVGTITASCWPYLLLSFCSIAVQLAKRELSVTRTRPLPRRLFVHGRACEAEPLADLGLREVFQVVEPGHAGVELIGHRTASRRCNSNSSWISPFEATLSRSSWQHGVPASVVTLPPPP